MAETLSPNPIPNPMKQKPPIPAPTSPYFLGSNDDQLERAAARAARAAAFRRKPVEVHHFRSSLPPASCLNRRQIMELFQNCVKLASENKINQKNTWELKLIDHLSEIIEAESEENNAETNFQKASCTLETGVKIYAARVDAWHADAYRVLNGISRVGLEEKEESLIRGDKTSKEREVGRRVKEEERKVSPLSTVESSFETLNVKKLDVAFAVDPLYYQTSAQFDEGGAKGLLLCNLGLYGGCRVLFDSQEIPAKCISPTNSSTSSDLVDVSFAKDCIELMAANLHQQQDISPSLRVLLKQIDLTSDGMERNVHGNVIDSDEVEFNMGTSDPTEDIGVEINDGSCDDTGEWSADSYYDTNVSDNVESKGNPTVEDYYEQSLTNEPIVSDNFENAAWIFSKGMGCKLARNAWAGPDHWTYSKPNGPESTSAHDTGPCAAKRPKYKIISDSDIEFTRSLDDKVPDICVPVKNLKSLLLPPKKVSCTNKLPEDCHYQPEDLVKLFLLPNLMCLGKIRRRVTGPDSLLQSDDFDGSFSSWDNDSTVDGPYDGYNHRDAEDILVSEPRRVDKIEVEYDKTSKQVDVHVLKETLWTLVQGLIQTPEVKKHPGSVSFRQVLTTFPDDCKAAATRDISPHLCFICLLHLANEHGLTIVGCPNLDDLSINLPVACEEETGATGCDECICAASTITTYPAGLYSIDKILVLFLLTFMCSLFSFSYSLQLYAGYFFPVLIFEWQVFLQFQLPTNLLYS
ncbi:condensin complex subunit 2 isoform X1 [Spinacia oleracea]|uniref:Condensin complex subunit 2 n=1 Tax=Spinacia oleracea TaxID=3562 RepID=A0ABM3RPZ1_SPIOL|nr:condensin complex subunit 2-like isoform X1 [Spinacia oleracea]